MSHAAPDVVDRVLTDVEVDGTRRDVTIGGGVVTAVDPAGTATTDGIEVLDGRGGALLPGLHDHHLHLMAMAAAARSVGVGPRAVSGRQALGDALATAPDQGDGWIRAVGYHESVAGPLDREVLDELVPDRPVRVQHRTGAAWFLNTAALERLRLTARHPTGRIYGEDRLVRLPGPPPDLAPVSRALAACGVTGVTDATPYEEPDGFTSLADAVQRGAVTQHLVVTGGAALAGAPVPDGLRQGPVKLLVADHALPPLDDLADQIRLAHRHRRAVAIHCVTRVGLVLALAAWEAAGVSPGDRVEHASVAPPELRAAMARLGLTVVTQPGFVAERGDDYLHDVEPDDRDHLYPCRSLEADGVRLGGSTDAPYSSADPWDAIHAAVQRRTAAGVVLGPDERLPARRALDLFLTPSDDPGGHPRRVEVGAEADLCLLSVPLAEALRTPTSQHVAQTFRAGQPLI
jgi:predicted amidohydrolase YtcJ